jgi:predicted anti-sigma-YlaC factor YlaD
MSTSGCDAVRATLHERLDGPVEARAALALDAHLQTCAACRELEAGLAAVRDGLRALPTHPFPDDALQEVWALTLEAPRERSRYSWRLAAAAAVLLALILPLAAYLRSQHQAARLAELERADREVRTVLGIASRAVRRSEWLVRDEVLVGQVSPAVRRIPIRWPKNAPHDTRRSGT